jgi:NarL family two-component system response regulator LiaR
MPHKKPIRILLVDDHSVVRSGLAMLIGLEEDFAVVGEAEDGAASARNFPRRAW